VKEKSLQYFPKYFSKRNYWAWLFEIFIGKIFYDQREVHILCLQVQKQNEGVME